MGELPTVKPPALDDFTPSPSNSSLAGFTLFFELADPCPWVRMLY